MRDARHLRALESIARIRDAERSAARHALFAAERDEREAAVLSGRAAGAVVAASDAWREHLSGAFAPELARALAALVVERVASCDAAEGQYAARCDIRTSRMTDWHDSDARCRQAEASFRASRHEANRRREERALQENHDRVTIAWSTK